MVYWWQVSKKTLYDIRDNGQIIQADPSTKEKTDSLSRDEVYDIGTPEEKFCLSGKWIELCKWMLSNVRKSLRHLDGAQRAEGIVNGIQYREEETNAWGKLSCPRWVFQGYSIS